MPIDAPATKLAATREYGGTIITYERYKEDRERLGRSLVESYGMTLVPPYDHPDVIAGQGTRRWSYSRRQANSMRSLSPWRRGLTRRIGSCGPRALTPLQGLRCGARSGNDGQQSFRSGRMFISTRLDDCGRSSDTSSWKLHFPYNKARRRGYSYR